VKLCFQGGREREIVGNRRNLFSVLPGQLQDGKLSLERAMFAFLIQCHLQSESGFDWEKVNTIGEIPPPSRRSLKFWLIRQGSDERVEVEGAFEPLHRRLYLSAGATPHVQSRHDGADRAQSGIAFEPRVSIMVRKVDRPSFG
jgi:hypothetical protein